MEGFINGGFYILGSKRQGMVEKQYFHTSSRRHRDVYASRTHQPRSILHKPQSTANNQSADLLFCPTLIDSDDPLTEDTQIFTTSTSSAAPTRPTKRSSSSCRNTETASRI
ncbi:unnamed protein product [Rodentolepis nana]|uniref:Uncharacterized protein n=1 Tax=Rodentolepis nana TaxID=102285 RepID=A0A0R3TR29_RODNA|nr:unnamed protein product [Rodentolepis nana]